MLATIVAFALGLPVARVTVPESIVAAVNLPEAGILSQFTNPTIIMTALAIAFIASAETLLSAAAVDRMHDGVRTDYNKELRAQGVGNMLCGAAGAIPMTGVIVRSSANVQAGAMTRLSAILHGVWILGFVALLPWLLREIPMAALAGILVVTGVRLVSVDHVKHLFHQYGPLPAIIWAVTLVMVVTTDLLTGVLTGLALSVLELLPHVRRLGLTMDTQQQGGAHEIALGGSATFLSLPKLSAKLEEAPVGQFIRLNMERLSHIDHTCAEMLREWIERRRRAGGNVELAGATDRLRRYVGH
jgi:MFS superfamily sulfate permease-like transporter